VVLACCTKGEDEDAAAARRQAEGEIVFNFANIDNCCLVCILCQHLHCRVFVVVVAAAARHKVKEKEANPILTKQYGLASVDAYVVILIFSIIIVKSGLFLTMQLASRFLFCALSALFFFDARAF
jgi:hypothetical protein